MANKAKLAPNLPNPRSVGDLTAELHQILRNQFCLDPIPTYSIFVEGWTDYYYLERAAQLVLERDGEDLLAVQLPDGKADRIAILTPGRPGDPNRGGVPQIERLARELEPHVFHFSLYAVCFLLDHDDAGVSARNRICQRGYQQNMHCLTLNPQPRDKTQFNVKDEKVIEDLLPLQLQLRFFEQCHDKWCTVTYEAGQVGRFQWNADSKGKLQQFACNQGKWEDFREIARVLNRVRSAMSLPVNTTSFNEENPIS